MRETRKASGILADTKELKKLILEHPDFPIAVVCSEDANCGDYSWMYASDVSFGLGEILDTDQPVDDDIIFQDRDDFEERLEEWLWDNLHDGSDEDVVLDESAFQKVLAEEKKKYEPYWKDCILIYAGN